MLSLLYISLFVSLFTPAFFLPTKNLPPFLNPAALSDTPTPTLSHLPQPSPTLLIIVEATSTPSGSPTPAAAAKFTESKPTTKVLAAKKAESTQVKEVNPKSAQAILEALNSYREKNGVGTLSWNNSLADLAKSRVEHFINISSIDNHAGFKSFLEDDGFNKLGFMSLGENSGKGNFIDGTNLIERFYGSHGPHNENQLDPKWSHVGIAVSGNFTNLVFGGNPI